MNPQFDALMDYFQSTRGTQPTAPTNNLRAMPGTIQPVQPLQSSAFQPNNRLSPQVSALTNYYGQMGQGQPLTTPSMADFPAAPAAPNAPGYAPMASTMSAMQAPQGPYASPIGQPRTMASSFVTTPNTPSVNYEPPMSPQVQALRNFYRQ